MARAFDTSPNTPAQLRAVLSRLRDYVGRDGEAIIDLNEFKRLIEQFFVRSAVADSDIPARSVVRVSSEGHIDLADASDILTADAAGLAIDDIANGGAGEYRAFGVVESTEWVLVPGQNYYLSTTAGGLATTPTDTTGAVSVIIGRAVSTTELFVNISQSVIL